MKAYVTFGQDHSHTINGITYDKDRVAVIESENAQTGHAKAFELFGPVFCFEYTDEYFDWTTMKYYYRGLRYV